MLLEDISVIVSECKRPVRRGDTRRGAWAATQQSQLAEVASGPYLCENNLSCGGALFDDFHATRLDNEKVVTVIALFEYHVTSVKADRLQRRSNQ